MLSFTSCKHRAVRECTWGLARWSTTTPSLVKQRYERAPSFAKLERLSCWQVLTCAHVVCSRDDEASEERGERIDRVGREKILMFPSGRMVLARCASVIESPDGVSDVAVLHLGAEIDLASLHPTGRPSFPRASLARQAAREGERLFCVGNPSDMDLEEPNHGNTEFEPPIWHTSVGCCEGYKKSSHNRVEDGACCVLHSCWTYWGHSGAPLFNEQGEVCGLHSSWDENCGMRLAQGLPQLQTVLAAADRCDPPVVRSKRAGLRVSDRCTKSSRHL